MLIYDMLEYDAIDNYMRDNESFNSSFESKSFLANWFLSEKFTEELFLELITMKSFKLQNRTEASEEALKKFKSFMAEYYLGNPNITTKSFKIIIDYLIETNNFRDNTDSILQSKMCTEEVFNMAIDAGFLGTDRNTLSHLFSNVKMSEKTLLKYMDLGYNERQRNSMIKLQDLSDKLIKRLIDESKNKVETIFLLTEYKHFVDPKLFIGVLATYDPDEIWGNPSKGLKQMILKDRTLIDEIIYWKSIKDFIIDKANSKRDKAIVFSSILTYKNIKADVLDFIVSYPSVIEYIIDKMNLDKIPDSTKNEIYKRTNYEAFLPDDIKDIFIF